MPNLNSENRENKKILDIVNEKDEIINSKPRNEVYKFGLLHREIHVWMFDENKNIFFQKRGLDRRTAGLLDATIGGHVDQGESYEEAAIRESWEETGILINASDLLLLKKVKNTTKYKDNLLSPVKRFFRCIYIYKNPVTEDQLRKEGGVPGVGFQKISSQILKNESKDYEKLFIEFVFKEELPLILEYLK